MEKKKDSFLFFQPWGRKDENCFGKYILFFYWTGNNGDSGSLLVLGVVDHLHCSPNAGRLLPPPPSLFLAIAIGWREGGEKIIVLWHAAFAEVNASKRQKVMDKLMVLNITKRHRSESSFVRVCELEWLCKAAPQEDCLITVPFSAWNVKKSDLVYWQADCSFCLIVKGNSIYFRWQ